MSLAIGGVAGAVALALGWLQWPRPPRLDGERWFKVALCTLLRGRVEAEGGDADAWERAVVRFVPYHPAGRLPERKVSNPVAGPPGAALPGEVALLEALAAEEGPARRWARMYDLDEGGLDARLSDPSALGAAYDPARILGRDASWDALARWARGDDTFLSVARRRIHARWVLVEGREDRRVGPSVLPALAALLPDAIHVPFEDGDPEVLAVTLRSVPVDASGRVIVVAEEAGVTRALRALAAAADVRDLLLALISVGGVIGGRTDEEGPYGAQACRDWNEAHFDQSELDTDVVRLTPYLALQWLDREVWPPGVPGLPLDAARFPEPRSEGATATTLEVVDLGPLPADEGLPVDLVARALIAVASAWVATRQ